MTVWALILLYTAFLLCYNDIMDKECISFDKHKDVEHGIQIFFYIKDTLLYSLHNHDFYEIFFVIKGSATHYCNGKKFKIETGTIVFIRPGDEHQYLEVSDNFAFYNLVFSRDSANKIFSFYGREILTDILGGRYPLHRSIIFSELEKMEVEFKKDIETTDLRTRSVYNLSLLTSLIPFFISSNHKKDHLPGWFSDIIEKLDRDKNFIKGISYLNEISTRSKEHVSRSFKKYINMTPTEYINNKKLNYASNLLKQTNIELINISEMAGFNSHSHFYHLFKDKFKCSPKEYREKRSTSLAGG